MELLIDDQREIAHWIARQQGPLRIAVAFWGHGALKELRLARYRGDVRVLLELSAGATNPEEVRALMRQFPRCVRMLDRLHAKAWISDQAVLVGSANASANGLGFEGDESRHWRELGLTCSDPLTIAKAKAWFDRQWTESRAIKPADLAQAQKRWTLRRAMRPPSGRPVGNLLEAVSDDPIAFRDKRIFVVAVDEDMTDAGKKDLDDASERAGAQQYAYEDWRGIPLNATLISFSDYGDGLKQDKPPVYTTASDLMKGRLQFVFPKEDVFGYSVKPFGQWKTRLNYLAKHRPRKWNGGDMCMELLKFVEATNGV